MKNPGQMLLSCTCPGIFYVLCHILILQKQVQS